MRNLVLQSVQAKEVKIDLRALNHALKKKRSQLNLANVAHSPLNTVVPVRRTDGFYVENTFEDRWQLLAAHVTVFFF